MATELAKAYVQIIPSAQGISSGISDILNNDAQKAGASSGKTFSSAFGGGMKKGIAAIGGVATMAAAGITALGSSIVSNAKDTAAYGDNVDKLSQKIGISKEAFQEWDYVFSQNGTDIGILQTGMKKLSSTFADAQSGSSGAIEKFTALGLSMEELQGMTQEDLFSAVVKQLQEMGPSAERTAIASDLLGKSATELGPLLNQTASDTEALKQKAHDLGMVMSDEAVAASAAFTDSLDNLQRAFTGAKNSISATFLPALTDITNGFADLLAGNEGAADAIKNGFLELGSAIQEAIPGIVTGFTTIVDAVASVAPDIIKGLGDGIIQALPQLTTSVMQILPQLTSVFLQMLPELVEVGSQMLIEIGSGIAQALPELIPQITETVIQMIEAFVSNVPQMVEVGVQIILALIEGLVAALPQLIQQLPGVIGQIVSALMESLPLLIQGAIQLVTMLAQNAPTIIQAFVEAIPEMITSIVTALTDPQNISAIINGLIQLFIAVAAAMPQIALALVQAIPQVIDGIIQAFMQLAPQLMATLTQVMMEVGPTFNQLAAHASNAWSLIQNVFANVGAWFRGKFNEAVTAIKSVFSTLKDFFIELYDSIIGTFSNIGEKFMEVGSNIVAGIKEGIGGSWKKLKDWLEGIIGDLVEFAKKILGIESPSKVFRDQVGQWIPAGIAEGIESGMPTLNHAIDTMTGEMLSTSVSNTLDTVNTMNYVPESPVANENNKAVQLLAEYLPLIAEGMNVDVTVKQNDSGIFEAVRRQNGRLVTATGYHALA